MPTQATCSHAQKATRSHSQQATRSHEQQTIRSHSQQTTRSHEQQTHPASHTGSKVSHFSALFCSAEDHLHAGLRTESRKYLMRW